MTRSSRRPGDEERDHGRRTQRTRFLEFLDHVLSEEDKTQRLALLIDVTAKAVVFVLFPVLFILLIVFLVMRVDLVWVGVSVLFSALGIGGVAKLRQRLRPQGLSDLDSAAPRVQPTQE